VRVFSIEAGSLFSSQGKKKGASARDRTRKKGASLVINRTQRKKKTSLFGLANSERENTKRVHKNLIEKKQQRRILVFGGGKKRRRPLCPISRGKKENVRWY